MSVKGRIEWCKKEKKYSCLSHAHFTPVWIWIQIEITLNRSTRNCYTLCLYRRKMSKCHQMKCFPRTPNIWLSNASIVQWHLITVDDLFFINFMQMANELKRPGMSSQQAQQCVALVLMTSLCKQANNEFHWTLAVLNEHFTHKKMANMGKCVNEN